MLSDFTAKFVRKVVNMTDMDIYVVCMNMPLFKEVCDA